MKRSRLVVVAFLVVLSSIDAARKLRSIQKNMYMTMPFDYCMRYLTSTGITGCSTISSGHRGRLLSITTLDDLKSHSSKSRPLIVLVPSQKDILESLIKISNVMGILIDGTTNETKVNELTEVKSCPESFPTVETCPIRKNPYGIDFRGIRIDKPIFLITNQTAIEALKNFSDTYNQQGTSPGKHIDVQMKSYPYGAMNAQICDRRSKSTYFSEAYYKHYAIKCRSPMINIVWSSFNAISSKRTRLSKSVVIVYTKLDFFSLFQPQHAGVQSTGCSVITLLGLAWALGQLKFSQHLIDHQPDKDLFFVFLNGENWNSYGTLQWSRLIISKGFPETIDRKHLHPIEPEHIDLILNLDQLGCQLKDLHILSTNAHPFLTKFSEVTSSLIIHEHRINDLQFYEDFRQFNITALAMLTNAYESMNPFYNSYRDTLNNLDDNRHFFDHIDLLTQVICRYFQLTSCSLDLIKNSLKDQIETLIECFFRSNCSNLIAKIDQFHFEEVTDQMRETFSFLQPILHQSDVKSYLNTHFLDASSYIHDILLNWIADRTTNTTKSVCEEEEENLYRHQIFQPTSETCLRVSIDSIDLIRSTNEPIDDRLIFISNHDEPELLIFMTSDKKREWIALICGFLLTFCGLLMSFFLKGLVPVLFDDEK